MIINKLMGMTKGWFVGNFSPSILKTDDVEIAVKEYKKGDFEEKHFHKIAKEITVIGRGKVIMNGREFKTGDIITINPGEITDFRVLEDAITTVVKLPCVKNDKYLV